MNPPPVPGQAPRQGRGCLFYGCLVTFILFVVVVVGGYLAIRQVTRSMLNRYTASQPAPVPRVETTAGERKALEQKVTEFVNRVQQGKEATPLVLAGRELNAWLNSEPALSNHLHVTIESNQIRGQISLPLDQFQIPLARRLLAGRYLNGNAAFQVGMANGVLHVNLAALEVNGQPTPDSIMANLRQENLAAGFTSDPRAAEFFRRLQGIEVSDGRILVQPKPAGAVEGSGPRPEQPQTAPPSSR